MKRNNKNNDKQSKQTGFLSAGRVLSSWATRSGSGIGRAAAGVVLALLASVAGAQAQPAVPVLVDANAAAQRLAGAVRIQTISQDDQPAPAETFRQLREYLEQQFPHVHHTLKREIVNGSSLLYTWQGSDPSAAPIMLMAHQDVVPIAPGTESQWKHAPFSGDIAEGFVWGRGSWDDKGNLMSIMEAVEVLTAQGFQPRHTIYLAFGHDEEIGGERGAHQIAALLKARGVRLASVLDEGLLITHHIIKGLDVPAALIGVAEKGYVTLSLSVEATPGHSSMPPEHTAIGSLSRAVARVEDKPFPLRLTSPVEDMLGTLAPDFSGFQHVALSNLWLFGPVVRHELGKFPSGAAMMRTTTAPTILQAGNKDNVLPGHAEAHINFRTLPGDSVADVINHTREAIGDQGVLVKPSGEYWEASRVSSDKVPAYELIRRTIEEVFPGTRVAPGLMVGATDSRHYQALADNVYRFTPVHALPVDLPRFHGTNERVSVANYADMIRFYARLLSSPVLNDIH